MSTRSRRKRSPGPPGAQPVAGAPGHQPTPLPKWEWRTFPVLFAFSVGGLLGIEAGIISTVSENFWVTLIAFSIFGIPFGFGFSRLVTRFMISRNWVKPRPPSSRRRA